MSDRNFFAELKRRNVYKVAVAYAVVGWLVMQVAATIVPALHFPDAITSAVVVVTLLGFPIALVIAWAFELTPEGIKRSEVAQARREHSRGHAWIYIALIGSALSIGLFFLGRYTAAPAQHATVDTSVRSIAVLPFVNMSSDKENEYFVDGLTEEILNGLAQISALKVPGRTSSFAFKDKNTDLRQIGNALGVANVLEGSVRKAGDRLRITAQLVRTADGYHLWSQAYDRKLDDVFAIQEEIAQSIAHALAVELKVTGNAKSEKPTENIAAYSDYLEARALLRQRQLPRAITLLRTVVQRDPNFGKAWAALAQARALWGSEDGAPRKEAVAEAESAARKALAIDESIELAHSALGDLLSERNEWAASEREFRRALELNPSEAETHNQYAQVLLGVGRLNAALEHAKRACELDPLASIPPAIAALIELSRNQLTESRAWIDRHDKVVGKPDFFSLRLELYYALSRHDAAQARRVLAAARSSAPESQVSEADKKFIDIMDQALASTLDPPQPPPDFRRALQEAVAIGLPSFPGELAVVFAFANQRDIAFDILTAAMRSDIPDAGWIWTPPFQPLRNDPRFLEILKLVKLPEYWRVAGWPDFCRPKGDNDFECVAK